MKAIDNLDKIIQLNISWLRNNTNIKIFQSQKFGLDFIVKMIIEMGMMENEYWDRIKPPFYKSDNSSINDFSLFILQLAKWLIDNPGTDVSNKKKRLSTLKDLINNREVMTDEEESKIMLEIKKNIAAKFSQGIGSKMKSELNKRIDSFWATSVPDKEKLETLLKCKEFFELIEKKDKGESDERKMWLLFNDNEVFQIALDIQTQFNKETT